MQNSPKASIVISVYKNIQALNCLLDSLKMQSEQSFEIIISEDGDSPQVAEFCRNYPFQHDYQHLTQLDEGWRKNRALNRAIYAAKSDYLIFIDGDCIPHPRFVEQHLRLSGKRKIVAGKRVKLNESLSQLLIADPANYQIIESRLKKHIFKMNMEGNAFVEEGLFFSPCSLLGIILRFVRRMRDLKGCNMSFYKDSILEINGFDEEYTLPAIGEDIDLGWRFRAVGYRICSARNLAVQYHLHHKENWSDQSINIEKMEQNIRENRYFCRRGLINNLKNDK